MSRGVGSEGMIDPEHGTIVWDNQTELDDSLVRGELFRQHPEIAALASWSSDVQGMSKRRKSGSLFDRDRYVTPARFIDQIDTARDAVRYDDVVSGIVDTTESLAFSRIDVEADDPDEEDIWNQIAEDLNFDARLREMWRELLTVSQFYVFQWWGTKDYKVSGRSQDSGSRRKKMYKDIRVPLGLTLLDPKKIIPIGSGFFNQERLLYIPTDRVEQAAIEATLDRTAVDPLIDQMILARYSLSTKDLNAFKAVWDFGTGINLYECNPKNVWRHTLTRPQWSMLADLRMASVFELLDMKTQLKEMDRAHLIGGTNFIILIKKGSDQIPARPVEVSNLQNSVRMLARVPLLVGDHRLSIEIITPKLDVTLTSEKYDLLDSRIAMRMFQMFTTNSGRGAGGEDSAKLGRVISRGLESRRHMLRRSIEEHVLDPIYDLNDQFKDEPCLRFSPKQISLTFDNTQAMFYMDLRDRREISRDTLLAQIDLSEDSEARKMKREKEYFDDIFQSEVPFSGKTSIPTTLNPTDGSGTPPAQSPRSAGRTQGGNKNGGGAAPGTGQGTNTGNPKADNGSTRKS